MNDLPAAHSGWDGGWWHPAKRHESPNFDLRPDGCAPSLVVLHHISLPAGRFGGDEVNALFENRLAACAEREDDPETRAALTAVAMLRVSAHFFLRRDGSLTQFVSCAHRAWHAGVSCWRGRHGCNDFSLGIELEGTASVAFTDAQYAALDALLAALVARYPIRALTTHSEIAAGRKIDPGPMFDFSRLRQGAASPHRLSP